MITYGYGIHCCRITNGTSIANFEDETRGNFTCKEFHLLAEAISVKTHK